MEDGGEEKDELCPCFSDTIFMSEAGHKLKLLEVSMASAMLLYQDFRINCINSDEFQPNYKLAAIACISLGAKMHENTCKIGDLVNTCYRCLHPDKPMLDTCEIYYRLKESIAKYELIILRVVKFKLNHDLPHKYLLHFLLSLQLWADYYHLTASHVIPLSWAFLQDTFHTNLNRIHSPVVMATAVLYFAVKSRKARIINEGAKRKWWEVFCPDAPESVLISITETMMDFYDRKNTTKFESLYDRELAHLEKMSRIRKLKGNSSDEEKYLI